MWGYLLVHLRQSIFKNGPRPRGHQGPSEAFSFAWLENAALSNVAKLEATLTRWGLPRRRQSARNGCSACPSVARALGVLELPFGLAPVQPERSKWTLGPALVPPERAKWPFEPALVPPERSTWLLGLALVLPERSKWPLRRSLVLNRLEDCARDGWHSKLLFEESDRSHETLFHYTMGSH